MAGQDISGHQGACLRASIMADTSFRDLQSTATMHACHIDAAVPGSHRSLPAHAAHLSAGPGCGSKCPAAVSVTELLVHNASSRS